MGNYFRLTLALSAGIGAIAAGSLAIAQTATSTAAASQPEEIQEVTVTGSRVITNGNDSPTPTTVLNVEDILTVHPTTIADALGDVPTFSGSRGQVTNGGTPSGASAQLNLRNMGALRTLVLFDGHRLAPSTEDGTIDANMVPQMLLQRVDVVTGGVSAVYGSDGVTGVVNFITDTHFNGVKLKASQGISNYRDDYTTDVGIAAGTSLFDGKGHVEGSFEYYDDLGVPFRSARQWGRDLWTVQGLGTAASPYVLVENSRNGNTSFNGLITSGTHAGYVFTGGGTTAFGITPFVNGVQYAGGYQSGGGGTYGNSSLKSPLRSGQAFGRFDYELTPDIGAYVQAAMTWNDTEQLGANGTTSTTQLSNVTINGSDPFLPASAMQSGTFKFSKVLQTAPRNDAGLNEQQSFIVAGLDGKFLDHYKWDVAYSHNENFATIITPTQINNGNLYAALDAATNSAGQIVCNVTITNPGLYPGCAPLDVFGPNSESQAAINYILNTTYVRYRYLMDDGTASVSGAPFSTWAGPVNIALSGEWRRLTYSLYSNALPTQLLNCTGLRFNCSATTMQYTNTTPNRSPVSQAVSEGAIEADVPILKDLPLVQSLNINGAVRYTDYTTSGTATTYKVGLEWHMDPQLTIRATNSRDIRAPNLNDLFASPSVLLASNTDLLTSLTPTNVPVATQGNPTLKPEVSSTWTAGFVYQPAWLPNFSIAIDGYDITVRNAISKLTGTDPTIQRLCYASGGASPYCELIVRPFPVSNTSPANVVTEWLSSFVNIAEQHTYGADFEVNYHSMLFDHPWSVRELLDWQPHLLYEQPGEATYDEAGVAFASSVNTLGGLQALPRVRSTTVLHYGPVDDFGIEVMERWRSSMNMMNSTVVSDTPKVASVAYTNLTLTYTTQSIGTTQIYFTITNLLNQQPPAASFGGQNTYVGIYNGFAIGDDPVGREFSLGLRMRL